MKTFSGLHAWFSDDVDPQSRRLYQSGGGTVDNGAREPHYYFANRVPEEMKDQDLLVFSPLYIQHCIAAGALLNAGPYILYCEDDLQEMEEGEQIADQQNADEMSSSVFDSASEQSSGLSLSTGRHSTRNRRSFRSRPEGDSPSKRRRRRGTVDPSSSLSGSSSDVSSIIYGDDSLLQGLSEQLDAISSSRDSVVDATPVYQRRSPRLRQPAGQIKRRAPGAAHPEEVKDEAPPPAAQRQVVRRKQLAAKRRHIVGVAAPMARRLGVDVGTGDLESLVSSFHDFDPASADCKTFIKTFT